MAVPTISNVTPNVGHTGGKVLTQITGTNFRQQSDPPATGPTSPLPPSVEVEFNSISARSVAVLSTTRLAVVTPIHDAGAVDVTVRNIDDNGDPITNEEATLEDGYTFKLPPLAAEADSTRVVRALVLEMERQITPEIALSAHTDYDPETGDSLNIIDTAKLPAIHLVGPDMTENRLFALNEPQEGEIESGEFEIRRKPYTVDLSFSMVGASDHPVELLNLAHAAELFFNRNRVLRVDRDPDTPAAGSVEYEMDLAPDGDVRVTMQPGKDSLGTFVGAFVIRGVDLEQFAGLTDDALIGVGAEVETIEAELQEKG